MRKKEPYGLMMLLFTLFTATRFAMHRIYANRINSRGMSRVFCDLRSQKTPRGILPVNSNLMITVHTPLSREVFWHEYAKIPRHTSQNSIAAGNLEFWLRYWERSEQKRLMEKENVNHHKIYNIYVKNNVFFYVSRETLCGMIKIKVL